MIVSGSSNASRIIYPVGSTTPQNNIHSPLHHNFGFFSTYDYYCYSTTTTTTRPEKSAFVSLILILSLSLSLSLSLFASHILSPSSYIWTVCPLLLISFSNPCLIDSPEFLFFSFFFESRLVKPSSGHDFDHRHHRHHRGCQRLSHSHPRTG